MTVAIKRLFDQLTEMPRYADVHELAGIFHEWRDNAGPVAIRTELLAWLQEPALAQHLGDTARETSTHYVWPVFRGDNGFCVVINEFKQPEHMTAGYAASLHNHRYSFASLVLSGSYCQVRSTVEIGSEYEHASAIYDIGQDLASAGTITVITHDVFHRLVDVAPRTITLVAKCPATKNSSLSVDLRTRRASRHIPVEARVRNLMRALASAEQEIDTPEMKGSSYAGLA
jgi:hypothetical protein